MNKDPVTRMRRIQACAGIVLLLLGYGLYLSCRWPGTTAMHAWPVSRFLTQLVPHVAANAPWVDWMPTFIFVLAFSLLHAGLVGYVQTVMSYRFSG